MKRISFIAICYALSIIGLASCGGDKTTETTDTTTAGQVHAPEHHDTMAHSGHNKMMRDMAGVKMTGNFDVDFAKMMIPHHQGAIDMAEAYIPKAKDDMIRAMAQRIADAQKGEILQMEQMMSKIEAGTDTSTIDAGHQTLVAQMDNMMKEMNNVAMTVDADKDFVAMMIPHHQGAVNMAEAELVHGKNDQMKAFARKIIKDQKSEIKAFKDWQDTKK